MEMSLCFHNGAGSVSSPINTLRNTIAARHTFIKCSFIPSARFHHTREDEKIFRTWFNTKSRYGSFARTLGPREKQQQANCYMPKRELPKNRQTCETQSCKVDEISKKREMRRKVVVVVVGRRKKRKKKNATLLQVKVKLNSNAKKYEITEVSRFGDHQTWTGDTLKGTTQKSQTPQK